MAGEHAGGGVKPVYLVGLGVTMNVVGVTFIGRYDSDWTLYVGALLLGAGLGLFGGGITWDAWS